MAGGSTFPRLSRAAFLAVVLCASLAGRASHAITFTSVSVAAENTVGILPGAAETVSDQETDFGAIASVSQAVVGESSGGGEARSRALFDADVLQVSNFARTQLDSVASDFSSISSSAGSVAFSVSGASFLAISGLIDATSENACNNCSRAFFRFRSGDADFDFFATSRPGPFQWIQELQPGRYILDGSTLVRGVGPQTGSELGEIRFAVRFATAGEPAPPELPESLIPEPSTALLLGGGLLALGAGSRWRRFPPLS